MAWPPHCVTKVTVFLTITAAKGLEDVLQAELSQLCPHLEFQLKPGLVQADATLEDMYFIALHSRLANRVLVKVAEGAVTSADELYRLAESIDWPSMFPVNASFAVDFSGTDKVIRNTQFGALTVKDAVVDSYSRKVDDRPFVDKQAADWRIHVRLHRQQVQLFLDMGAGSLHQRAYRQQTGDAPIKEHLAAAMLIRSGWSSHQSMPLYDPMCGSGTIAIEAALMASNVAPGLRRIRWGFDYWQQHDESVWNQIKQQAEEAVIHPEVSIFASDTDAKVIEAAKQNAEAADVAELIHFKVADATQAIAPCEQPGFVVSNPPYGERLGELASLLPVFEQWGRQLKAHYAGWQLALLTSNRDLLRQLKLGSHKQYNLMNGKLACQLVLYSMDERNCEEREARTNNDFANRLSKNLARMKNWIKRQDTDCYRVYDADLPEYNVAIDRYQDWVVVNEYAAPKNVPEAKTRQRLMEVVQSLPQVMGVAAANIVVKVREQQKGTRQYQKLDQKKDMLEVYENGARFWVNLHDYLDTGLFLDHRITRQLVQQRSRNKEVLNLFSYTGSVSVHAALGGARRITTVDMSKTYLEWAKKNFTLNKLSGAYKFEQADCLNWLKQDKAHYDLIFIDPPSFSNSKRMDTTWDVQRDYLALLADAKQRLSSGGEIIFSNNLRKFKFDTEAVEALGFAIEDWCQKTLPEDFKRNPRIHHCWLLVNKD